MSMDQHTLALLEFKEIKSLITQHTRSTLGLQTLSILTPQINKQTVIHKQKISGELLSLLSTHSTITGEGIPDITNILSQLHINGTILDSESLICMLLFIQKARYLKQFIMNTESLPALTNLLSSIPSFPNIEKAILDVFADDGQIKDSASSNLKHIRSEIKKIRRDISTKLSSIITKKRNTGCFYNEQVTLREERYVLFVKSEYRSTIQGVIHDKSISGATSFIEPTAVIPLGNRLRTLKFDERNEIIRIRRFLSQLIANHTSELSTMIHPLAEFESLLAAVRFGQKYAMVCPQISENKTLKIINGFHPLLLTRIGSATKPISIKLDKMHRAIVVSGPNMGGKTVSLKTIGLLCAMFQCGFPIPVDASSKFPVFSNIFADIGDEQSLEHNMSTFSSHITRITDIIQDTNQNTLVLIDEFGTGTDPLEGAALAIAILLKMLEQDKLVIANTHLFQLKLFASKTQGIRNASLLFDKKQNIPTHQLVMDIPGSSNALSIAQSLGLPDELIEQARRQLGNTPNKLDTLIHDLHAEKVKLINAQKEYSYKKETHQILAIRYRKKLHNFEHEKKTILMKKLNDMDAQLKTMRKEFEDIVNNIHHHDKKQIKSSRKILERFHKQLKEDRTKLFHQEEESEEPSEPITWHIGDYVIVAPFMLKGKIISLNLKKNKAIVSTDNSRIEVSLKNLSPPTPQKTKSKKASPDIHITSTNSADFNPTLDLRGLFAEDALRKLEKHFSDVLMYGFISFTIIHGLGTGKLKRTVHEFLESAPYVKNFRTGKQEEGGLGVTVVFFVPA